MSATAPALVVSPEAAALLRGAAWWRLIGLLLERPRGGWWSDVARLGRESHDPDLCAAAEAATGATEGAYLAALGPGGTVSPREAGHVAVIQTGHLLADVSAFYAAFAYAPATEEPPDHVSVEAGFLAYLRLKEAYARAASADEPAQVTAQAAKQFLEAHLLPCAAGVAAGLAEVGPAYLQLVAQALARRVGPPRVRPDAAASSAVAGCGFTCGLAEEPGGGDD